MEDFMSVNVPGFDLISYCKTAKRRQIATTPSVAVSSSSSQGVIIIINYNRVNVDISKINLGLKDARGWDDACLVNVKVNGIFKFILNCMRANGDGPLNLEPWLNDKDDACELTPFFLTSTPRQQENYEPRQI
ncbi:hypothetical protein TNCV_97061 [Trichonephila clavipes]|nr:hypothetical protein TNCV_97061 [Trichonephila clavipes]